MTSTASPISPSLAMRMSWRTTIQGEFRIDPVPDNVVALTKTNPFFTITGIARFQANEFFTTTERLPEVVLDIKRHALFGGPIFTKARPALLICGYNSLKVQVSRITAPTRFDTFHQLTYPNTYFGWLSIVPRVGFRGTYYGKTWDLGSTTFVPPSNPLVPDFILPPPTLANPVKFDGDTFRTVFDTGAEASFQDLANMGERAKPRGWVRWTHARYSTVHKLFIRFDENGAEPHVHFGFRSI